MAVLNSQKSNDGTTANSVQMSQINVIHDDHGAKNEQSAAEGVNVTKDNSRKKTTDRLDVSSMRGTKGRASKFRDRTYSSKSDASSMSMRDICRICHLDANVDEEKTELIFPCACRYAGVHQYCIYKWALKMKSNICEICEKRFDAKYVPEIPQPCINWNFVPSYTRRRTIIAVIVMVFLVAITCITSYLLANTLKKNTKGISDSVHIVWPLIAVVAICGMGFICFVTWFMFFLCETFKVYHSASSKHRKRIQQA
ncbi:E3 ubiquitin-protein ligase MARCHF1-like [Glandiceps talaboti]